MTSPVEMRPRRKKDEPPPEMGEGSKLSSLPYFVSRHLETVDGQRDSLRIWFSSNNLRVNIVTLNIELPGEYLLIRVRNML